MSAKVKRKVTVENNKDNADQHRRPSVFERLGPGAVSVGNTQQQERHNRSETQEKCRNWLRNGACVYGSNCRYQHDPFPNSSSRRNKSEKEIPEKDLRHKVRNKRDDKKESRTRSLSPKRKGSKRSGSRSRKGEHESKIKSTVVVTRPRSPATKNAEPQDREKKKIDGTWEDDSDDWPLDSTQLDYKEELTLERKRQQLQRELELEYQKERMMNENVTITKTVSFSESSSSSSSSESGSISTTSDSSSSSSDDDSDDSSSSSSSSSSSASRPPKKKSKKSTGGKETEIPVDSSLHKKPRDDYDKIKSSRAAKIGLPSRSPIPSPEPKSSKKGRDRRGTPPPASPKHSRFPQESAGSSRVKSRTKGPHTPSPPHSKKQRQWEQSSSADSRSADARQSRGKRHKKKRDAPRNDVYKPDRAPTPPPQLSSPNRTALLPNSQFVKKSRQKTDDIIPKSRQRNKDSPPLLLSRLSGHSNSPSARGPSGHEHHSLERDRSTEPITDRSKIHVRKTLDENLSQSKRSDSREQMSKRSRPSPRRDGYRDALSPPRGKLEGDGYIGNNSRKPYASPVLHLDKGDDRNDRRRRSPSPVRGGKDPRDRRSFQGDFDKKRDLHDQSPRPGRDNFHRNIEARAYPRKDNDIGKRGMSPDVKKGRDDKGRDRAPRDRNIEHESLMWNDDHKKTSRSNSANRAGDSRGWQDVMQLPPNSRNDRPRDKERDRKKGKDREMPHRSVEDGDKQRLPSPPIRGRSPLHGHHPLPDVDAPMPPQRGRLYEPDIPPGERDYDYGYDARRDPLFVSDRLMPPEYDPDLIRGPPVYGSEGYPEGARYRRDPPPPLKDQGPLPRGDRVGGYGSRDGVPPREMLPSRDLDRRNDDYLPDVPIDERHSYDERWGRNRPMRDDWDPYGGLPPLPPSAHPPPSSLDEDRYGMPRRRRASPDWQLRNDDRELPMTSGNHRQGNHPPLPSQRPDQRGSRSPPPKRMTDPGRNSWGERPGRNSSRGSDSRHDPQQKNQEDRKGRNGRRDNRDRNRRRDGGLLPETKPPLNKDKSCGKRPRSPSPLLKDSKKRKDDGPPLDSAPLSEKNLAVSKRPREEAKLDRKPPIIPGGKPGKIEPPSPKGNTSSRSSFQDKVDNSQKNSSGPAKGASKVPEKEEKKIKRVFPVKRDTCRPEDLLKRYGMIDDRSQGDDDFSDWSDGDDDLLNRDDFNEGDAGDDMDKTKNKSEELREKSKKESTPDASKPCDSNSRQATDSLESAKGKPKESVLQSSAGDDSREKASDDSLSSNKDKDPVQELKEYEAIDSFMVKDETDTDDYITTECVDYDPISDDELEAMIEEPDDQTVIRQDEKNENSGIIDALDVNWSTLMSEPRTKTDFVPGFARKRFKTAHVLSRIGFSQTLAGPEVTEKVFKFCQEQLDQEIAEQNQDSENGAVEEKKFVMEHHVAAFHVSISECKKERGSAFSHIGPNRRALCARKDLQIRKLLCQPLNRLVDQTPATYRQQSSVDKDLYKKSLELLNLRKSEYQARTVDVC